MTPQLLAAWKATLPAEPDTVLAAEVARADQEEERVAAMDAAFTTKFGPDLPHWNPEVRRTYLRLIRDVHRYYGQDAA